MRRQTEEELKSRLEEAKKQAAQLRARLSERRNANERRTRQRELAKKRRRGEILEERRDAKWTANPAVADAALRELDAQLTRPFDREAFGLPPLPSTSRP